jgi:hypothetical protein
MVAQERGQVRTGAHMTWREGDAYIYVWTWPTLPSSGRVQFHSAHEPVTVSWRTDNVHYHGMLRHVGLGSDGDTGLDTRSWSWSHRGVDR